MATADTIPKVWKIGVLDLEYQGSASDPRTVGDRETKKTYVCTESQICRFSVSPLIKELSNVMAAISKISVVSKYSTALPVSLIFVLADGVRFILLVLTLTSC